MLQCLSNWELTGGVAGYGKIVLLPEESSGNQRAWVGYLNVGGDMGHF